DTGTFAATTTFLRRVAARCPVVTIRLAAARSGSTIRARTAPIIRVVPTPEARVATSRIAVLVGGTTASEPSASAGLATTDIASVAAIVPATAEPATGLASIEPTSGTGLFTRAEAATGLVAPVTGIAPAFEAATFSGVLGTFETTTISCAAAAGEAAPRTGIVAALESASPRPIVAAALAGRTGLLAPESTGRAAALVISPLTAFTPAVEPARSVASLETATLGGFVAPTVAARLSASRDAAALTGIGPAFESTAPSARIAAVASPAGPGVGSATPEGLPIVVLFRHGAPFLNFAKIYPDPQIQSRTRCGTRARQLRPSTIRCSNADRGPRFWVPYR
ncbi:hypothetical protein, partial [Nocardia amamiensis]|uniref:hypothetical protein n=1 Tax=Nocardia amamiensis TaxID=404578 RepID=UPI0009FE9804